MAGVDIRPVRALFALADRDTAAVDENGLHCRCQYDRERHELHFPQAFWTKHPSSRTS
jgi:hypothetical protein